MKRIIERIKYWLQLFLLPIYGFSFLIPRDKNLWLFGSTFGRRFTDNPRYLYLYVSQVMNGVITANMTDDNPGKESDTAKNNGIADRRIRPVWISHDRDIVGMLKANEYEAYYYHSLKGIWLALRAGMYIFDNYSKDINFWQSGGAIKVNLWHGSGNKLTNHDNMFDRIRHPKNAWERYTTWLRRLSDEKPSHYILSTSTKKDPENMSAFRTDISHVIRNGQPRNDMLVPNENYSIRNLLTYDEKELLNKISEDQKKDYTLITYMPTFRPSEKKFFEVMDFERFDRFLKERRFKLYIKPHPKSRIKDELKNLSYENITVVAPEVDVYSFLGRMDMMVADYSSAYTDYMLLDRPVVAFWFDEEEYITQNRDCYIPMTEYMPELVARDMDELMMRIVDVLTVDEKLADRQKERERFFDDVSGRYAEDAFKKLREIADR